MVASSLLRRFATFTVFLFCVWQSNSASAAVVTDPTFLWTPIQYASPSQSDFADDQQTGNARSSADLIGDTSNAAFLTQYDVNNSPFDTADDRLLFRVRLGAAGGNRTPVFDRNLFIGIDGNGDGALDLFLGVHNQGSFDQLAIYGTGSDLNVSPDTTSITGPIATITQTSANYHYAPVDTADTDIDGDSETDYFLSFAFDFASIATNMFNESGVLISATTPLNYVLATATQDNSFNQDINGIPRNFDGSLTFTELGAFSVPISANGTIISAVPEPSAFCLLGLCMTLSLIRRSRD